MWFGLYGNASALSLSDSWPFRKECSRKIPPNTMAVGVLKVLDYQGHYKTGLAEARCLISCLVSVTLEECD